jgi:predicted TIM-barrel fold metal-dependent hydrolase
LAELPYFEVRDGRLVLADPGLGPMIDVHTHLALSYGRRTTVDLWQEHERTRHYLSLEHPLDLDIYINQNIPPADVKRMKRDLTFASLTSSGMRATHTVPNLTREMAELRVVASVLLPIDYPALSWNAEAFLDVASRRDDLVSLGSVHPGARRIGDRLEAQKARGARGVKVHPAVQMIAPNHPWAIELYRMCGELDLPIFFHCGPVGIEPLMGRRRSQVKLYAPAVARSSHTTFVLGHSGALQMEQALELCRSHPNVYLDVSCQSLGNVRKIIAEAPPERIVTGSDWPFYHQGPVLAKVLLATEGKPEMRRRVLWENAARLFDLEDRVRV